MYEQRLFMRTGNVTVGTVVKQATIGTIVVLYNNVYVKTNNELHSLNILTELVELQMIISIVFNLDCHAILSSVGLGFC